MSVAGGDFFAPPPFKAAEALVQLKRTLRDQRPLVERGDDFELHGKTVLALALDGDAVVARLARRPAQRPDWDRFVLKGSADVRKLVDELKKRLARWTEE
jgi:hypothetical protein